jgi:hypothetical protein
VRVRTIPFAVAIALATGAAAAPALAQRAVLAVAAEPAAARVQATGLLADSQFVALLRSGFPLRLHYRLELWRVRSSWFDVFVREVGWDAVARHDPLTEEFVLLRTGGATSRHATPEDLDRALAIPYRVTLTAGGADAYLPGAARGDDAEPVGPGRADAVAAGDVGRRCRAGNVGDALARGARTLRLAGPASLTLEDGRPSFRPARWNWEPGARRPRDDGVDRSPRAVSCCASTPRPCRCRSTHRAPTPKQVSSDRCPGGGRSRSSNGQAPASARAAWDSTDPAVRSRRREDLLGGDPGTRVGMARPRAAGHEDHRQHHDGHRGDQPRQPLAHIASRVFSTSAP